MKGDGGKPAWGIPLAAVSLAALIILPALVLAAIVHLTLTHSLYYTEVLKSSYLLKAFVEGRNAAADRGAREEIDRDVRLDDCTIAAAQWKEKTERAREAFDRINRTAEYAALEKKLAEMKSSSWKDVKNIYPDEKSFEKRRDEETADLGGRLRDIELYRDKNGDAIESAERELGRAKEQLEDAREKLEEKTREAERIIERHRDTFAAGLTSDLDRLGPRLTLLLNGKLIDGAVKREIEKQLEFLISYGSQPGATAAVRIPPVMISLWIDDTGGGRRHLLSQVFVDEIRKEPILKNRAFLLAVFRMSDTVLGEYLAGHYLKKAGLSLEDGIIRAQPPVLEGDAAVAFRRVMMGAALGRYLKYVAGAFFALYLAFLSLAPAPRRAKLDWLGRIFFVPSLLIVLASFALVIASGIVFDVSPYLVPDAMLIGFAKNIVRAATLYLILPVLAVFAPLLFAGLALRRAAKRT